MTAVIERFPCMNQKDYGFHTLQKRWMKQRQRYLHCK